MELGLEEEEDEELGLKSKLSPKVQSLNHILKARWRDQNTVLFIFVQNKSYSLFSCTHLPSMQTSCMARLLRFVRNVLYAFWFI